MNPANLERCRGAKLIIDIMNMLFRMEEMVEFAQNELSLLKLEKHKREIGGTK